MWDSSRIHTHSPDVEVPQHISYAVGLENLHISQARTKFKLLSFMTKTVKLNFASDRQFAADLWTCWHCPMVDSQSHVRICPAYEHLRAGGNLDNDQDLVRYFTQVIKFRDDMTN